MSNRTKLYCPDCDSDQVRPLSVIYEEQSGDSYTSGKLKARTFTLGLRSYRTVGNSSSHTQTLTNLARKVAPPIKETNGGTYVVAGIVGTLCLCILYYFMESQVTTGIQARKMLRIEGISSDQEFFLYTWLSHIPNPLRILGASIILVLFVSWCILKRNQYEKEDEITYQHKLAQWRNSYRCYDCGFMFRVRK